MNSQTKQKLKKSKKGSKADSGDTSSESPFKFSSHVYDTESMKQSIYAIKFNEFILDRNIFALCVVNRVLVLECVEQDDEDDPEEFCSMKLIRAYKEESDSYYALAWSYDLQKYPLLAVGGLNGIIRTISMNDDTIRHLNGHSKLIHFMQSIFL